MLRITPDAPSVKLFEKLAAFKDEKKEQVICVEEKKKLNNTLTTTLTLKQAFNLFISLKRNPSLIGGTCLEVVASV